MERLKLFYKHDGFFYLFQKLKSKVLTNKKLKNINIYQHYISANFTKSSSPFISLIEENHHVELNRKLANFASFFSRLKLRLLLSINESEIVENLLKEKEIDALNKNLIILSKYFHTLDKKFVDKRLSKTISKKIMDLSANLDVITLIHVFSSSFFIQKTYGNDLLLIIEEKLSALKVQNKATVDRYLDSNIKDNSIIFSLINIMDNCMFADLISEFLLSVMERRIFHLNLAEAVVCTIFLLENRMIDSHILKSLSIRIVHICISKNISLDFKAYQLIFDNISLLKILLDCNKLSFDNHTEMKFEELFCNYFEMNQMGKETKLENDFNSNNNNNKSNNNSNNNNKKISKSNKSNNNNANLRGIEQNKLENSQKDYMDFQFKILENSFFSNSSIILSKLDYTEAEIEIFFNNFNNEIYDSNYFKRFNLRKNPFDLLLLIKLLAKQTDLFMKIKNEVLRKIIDKVIQCFFNLENNLHNRLFFMINISLAKDCVILMRNLNTYELNFNFDPSIGQGKKNILEKQIKISYKQISNNYSELRDLLLIEPKGMSKEEADYLDKDELKYYFTTIALYFFEMFSLEKNNEKYVYFKDLVMEDLKNLVSMEIYNKADLKNFVLLLKKDNLICEDFKNNLIKSNNYYF